MSLEHVEKIAASGFSHISLSGNFGDPIYHRKFHELIGILNQYGKGYSVTTNGSRRNTDWWAKTISLLQSNPNAGIRFSVDGLEDTNHIYRVNSKWGDIELAMRGCADAGIHTIWKFIVFKHNQHQIEEARALATSWGVEFAYVTSSRYGPRYGYSMDDDPLKPDEKYVIPPPGLSSSQK